MRVARSTLCLLLLMILTMSLAAPAARAAPAPAPPAPPDTTPPVADAGPNQTVGQNALVTFNGTGSTDNVGIVNYTWGIPTAASAAVSHFALTFGNQFVFDPVRPYVYEMNATQIAFVNLTSGAAEQTFPFNHVAIWPMSLAISPRGNYLAVGIPTGNRGYYDFGPYAGYIAGFDLVTRKEISEFSIAYDIFDIAVTDDGYAILSGGSGQWTPLEVVSLATGTVAPGTGTIWQGSPIVLHPNGTRIYSVDGGGINPSAVHRFDFTTSGGISTQSYWPYWGPFPGSDLWAGSTRIVTSNGLLLIAQDNATNDMAELAQLAATNVVTAAFDPAYGLIAVYTGTELHVYDANQGILLTAVPLTSYVGALAFLGQDIEMILGGWYATLPIPELFVYGPTPSHTFQDAGTFIVRLTVFDAARNSGTDTMTVTVRDTTPPRADAGPDQTVIHGTPVILNGSGSTDNTGIVDYVWTFNDLGPKTLSGPIVTYTFSTIGTYLLTLTVTDTAGNTNASTVTITTIRDPIPPVAMAGPDGTIYPGMTYTFSGNGSHDNIGIASYAWTFDDGGPQVLSGPVTSHRFDASGDYTVTLTVRDLDGNNATATMVVHVIDVPLVTFDHASTYFRIGLPTGWGAQPDTKVGPTNVDVLAQGSSLQAHPAQLFILSQTQQVSALDAYLTSEVDQALRAARTLDLSVTVIEPSRFLATQDGRAIVVGVSLGGGAVYQVWAFAVSTAYSREWGFVGSSSMVDRDTYHAVFAAILGSFWVVPPPFYLEHALPFVALLTAVGAAVAAAAAWALERRRRPRIVANA